MLLSLRVKNLALVEEAAVEWRPGLNVVTGETGAGKSILIGALRLLLGERADRKWIRGGADVCVAEAVFDLRNAQDARALLEEFGIPAGDGDTLIVRRILRDSGSSLSYVNDVAVTLQTLKRLGDRLVDMHGPYDHQSLLDSAFQLVVLDAYGGLEADRGACAERYKQLAELEARRAPLLIDDETVAARIDLLAYRIRELEEANPQPGEDEAVAREHAVASQAQRILELGHTALGALQDGEANAFDALATAQRALEELSRIWPDAAAWRDELRETARQINASAESLREALDRVETDPGRLEWLEHRLALYQRLKKKYGADAAGLLKVLEHARAELTELQNRGERLAALDAEAARARAALAEAAARLSEKRRAIASKLADAVTAQLRELGFPHGAFRVELTPTAPGPTGADAVTFVFAPNPGEAAKPLRDVASSGEISRVMLATKVVLAKHDRIPVLVFDEVDANIGGEMGLAVGRKLAALGAERQVICITHLPQVAAFGDAHYAVAKRVREGRTFTEIGELDENARAEEIARMLGGKHLTRVTLQHAREMLSASRRAPTPS